MSKIFSLKGCNRKGIGYIGRVMKFFLITLGIASGLFVSCERQEFEGPGGTKQLHESHAAPGAAHGTAHGADPAAKEAAHEAPKAGH